MAYQQHSVRLYCSISLPSQLLCNSSFKSRYHVLEPREVAGTPGDRMYPAGGLRA
jgi:hypothetical protein